MPEMKMINSQLHISQDAILAYLNTLPKHFRREAVEILAKHGIDIPKSALPEFLDH
jgi:hypothetical protein